MSNQTLCIAKCKCWRIHAMADLYLRLKLRVEVMIMKYKLVYTRLQARNQAGTPGGGRVF